jgi:hypothetical protein
MQKTFIETAKFVVRMALFILVPILISYGADLQGAWQVVFSTVLPIVLPIIDKWVHEDSRIPARGITPF